MSRVLSAVRAQFGADSSEYEAVGGTALASAGAARLAR